MKKTLAAIVCVTISATAFLPLNTVAGTKKHDPDRREVENTLKEVGGEHYVERMKVATLCSLEYENDAGEDDYYHIYNATMKGGGYRIIIFNNVPEYLGFYPTEYEGADYEEDAILLDSGKSDSDGNNEYYRIEIPSKGPTEKIRIDQTPSKFVKNPNLEPEETTVASTGGIPAVPKETAASGEVIDYREWKITMQGKEITVNAKFEKVEGGKVYIKNAKNGKVAGIPGSALSDEDQEYVKRITAK